jgi:hypothetical protein
MTENSSEMYIPQRPPLTKEQIEEMRKRALIRAEEEKIKDDEYWRVYRQLDTLKKPNG